MVLHQFAQNVEMELTAVEEPTHVLLVQSTLILILELKRAYHVILPLNIQVSAFIVVIFTDNDYLKSILSHFFIV